MAKIFNLSIRNWLITTTLIAVVSAPPCRAAITCRSVYNTLQPCYNYVTGNRPLGGCCGGVRSLYNQAKTKEDKQSVCRCLKAVATSHSSINVAKAAQIPRLCNVNVPYPINKSIDCSKVK